MIGLRARLVSMGLTLAYWAALTLLLAIGQGWHL